MTGVGGMVFDRDGIFGKTRKMSPEAGLDHYFTR